MYIIYRDYKKKKNYTVPFISASWSGDVSEPSRSFTFSFPAKKFTEFIEVADKVFVYEDEALTKELFTGRVTSSSWSSDGKTCEVTAQDYLSHLLKSQTSHKFKNVTPKKVVTTMCGEVGISVGSLPSINTKIKLIKQDISPYEFIRLAYRKIAKGKYFITMKSNKLTVTTLNKSCGVQLNNDQLISLSISRNSEDVINKVRVYNDKNKQIALYKDSSSISKYGVIETTYTKEDKDYKSKAKALFHGTTSEITISCLGNYAFKAGYSVYIENDYIKGWYAIKSDSHSFENGLHTAELTIKKLAS